LLCLRDTESFRTGVTRVTGDTSTSENSHLLDTEFDFDQDVTASGVYKAAFRSNMRKAISKDKRPLKNSQTVEEMVKSTEQDGPQSQIVSVNRHTEIREEETSPFSSSEYSPVMRWLNMDGGILQTTEFGVSSSRISQSSRIRKREVGEPAYSLDPFPDSASQETHSSVNSAPLSSNRGPKISEATKYDSRSEDRLPNENKPLESHPFNVLLIGTANSGKSTIFKSIEAMCKGGWTIEERLEFKETILENILESMGEILGWMKALEVPFTLGNRSSGIHAKVILDHLLKHERISYPPMVWDAIDILWSDSGVQKAFRRRNEYQLQDNVA